MMVNWANDIILSTHPCKVESMKPKITVFDPSHPQHKTAMEIFDAVQDEPLICPHGHVDPHLFAASDARFNDPASLFVIPDHYVLRMLVSQGVSLEELGIQPKGMSERAYDPLKIWRIFCDHFSFLDGTPSGLWIENELSMVFGITQKPDQDHADQIYHEINEALRSKEFTPRQLYKKFNIEALCTTDTATDPLSAHQAMRDSGWDGNILPTFRPDALLNIGQPQWRDQLHALEECCDTRVLDFTSFIQALEERRSFFKSMGAVAADYATKTAFTCRLSSGEAETLFQKGLMGDIDEQERARFIGHMVFEMARMSVEDGLVMQWHVGAYRNHSPLVYEGYGSDLGFDIPLRTEWTRNIKPLLDAFGMDQRLRLILFTLDESSYSRELAPLAGVYPAVRLGPPWWFHDSPNGMQRYFDQVMETAGIDNTVGFNDDTRAFLSIPARHDLWRRMSALWLAGLVQSGQMEMTAAQVRMHDLAYGLAKRGYRLEGYSD